MDINNIQLYKLKNHAHIEFHMEVKKMIEKHGAEHLNVKDTFDDYIILVEKELDNLEIIKQSEITKQLLLVDKERDNSFKGLRMTIKSLTKHFKVNIRENAETLRLVFKNFGNITTLSYNEGTAAIDRLTDELKNNYANELLVCNIADWVDHLYQKNEIFRSLMLKRNEETSVKEPVNTRELRKELDKLYKLIVKRVNASALLNGDADYADFISQLNNRIEYFKTYNT